jgi:hypothetical protein
LFSGYGSERTKGGTWTRGSEDPTSTIPFDITKKPSDGSEILEVDAGGESSFEVGEKGTVAAEKYALVDVDG